MAAHIRWSCGYNVIFGGHTTFSTVNSSVLYRTFRPADGSPKAFSKPVSAKALSSTSRTARRGSVSEFAITRLSTRASTSNIDRLLWSGYPPFWWHPSTPCGGRRCRVQIGTEFDDELFDVGPRAVHEARLAPAQEGAADQKHAR